MWIGELSSTAITRPHASSPRKRMVLTRRGFERCAAAAADEGTVASRSRIGVGLPFTSGSLARRAFARALPAPHLDLIRSARNDQWVNFDDRRRGSAQTSPNCDFPRKNLKM